MMAIKSTFLAGAILALILATSCSKDKNVELFTMVQVYDFEIRAGLNTAVTHFFISTPFQSTFDQQLADVGRTEEDLNGVFPKFAQMSSVFNDVDLDIISAIEIRLYDPFDPDHSREVFYMVPVPANTNTVVRPFPGLSNVLDIVSEPTYGIEVRLIFRQIPATTFDMRLEMELSAQAR